MLKNISSIKYTENLLLVQNGFAYLAQTAFFSLAAVYFANVLNYSLQTTAWMMVYISIVLRTTRILFSPILDLIPFNVAFPFSLLLCAFGFLGLGIVKNPFYVALVILPIGIGYGVNNILIKYVLSEIKSNNSTLNRFTKFGVSVNLGAAIGPLVGNFFISSHYQFGVSAFCSGIFFIAFFIAILIAKDNKLNYPKQKWSKTIIKYLRLPNYRNYFILSCIGWFFYSQLISALPLLMSEGLSAEKLIGFIFFINALISILFPIKLMKVVQEHTLDKRKILNFSFCLYTTGFLIVAFFPNLIFLFLSVIIISFAEIIMLPTLNSYLIQIIPSEERIVGFTLSSLTMGFGEGIGAFIGTHAIAIGEKYNQWHLPFILISIISVFLMVAGFLIHKKSLKKVVHFG